MGTIDVNGLSYHLPGGRRLFETVSFKVGRGQHAALVGANGVGKTTLLGLVAGREKPTEGTIAVDGRLGIMDQLVGMRGEQQTVRDLFASLAPPPIVAASAELAAATHAAARAADGGKPSFVEKAGLRLARAHAEWGEVGGYEIEVEWNVCATAAVGLDLDAASARPLATFSGGEQKRLALEFLLRNDDEVLLLDEPDNFLDIPGKRWLEQRLNESSKTILFVSHDRELLARAAHRIVTIEGDGAWIHGGSFDGYAEARDARLRKLADDHQQWMDERKRLVDYKRIMKERAKVSDANASRARAAETRLRHFDDAGPPPERPNDQKITMRIDGGRTGKRAIVIEQLELTDLTHPWSTEIWFGERVGILGGNGTGKSHLLRLLAGDPTVAHEGRCDLGARVVPGHFSQTHYHPELVGRTLLDALHARDLARGPAMARLRRYELQSAAEQTFETLSGGQQARFQILLLELGGATLLLLDEPTDNLDVASADALEGAIASFEGTVVAVTHDRWFMKNLDRFLVFNDDGEVTETDSFV
ncbi:MAG: ABC-F family ATP-binding cassette domain-containing protein [Acidimicrobiales bacterium]